MELIERAEFLQSLQKKFGMVAAGEGHCIMVSGEAGIGKTSLIRAFCKEQKNDCKIYQGTCDSLFTPRPLAPLYDIIWQIGGDIAKESTGIADRSALFARFFYAISQQKETTLIVFEDIHWADEATLDFIKFFARRITQLRCLFILTYRDDEIHSRHPLRNVLGQLPADSFSRMQLVPLSMNAVQKLAEEKGYKGEEVYGITGGNPFYVNEILASYSYGIPDNIKDSILSVYTHLDEKTKQVWEILSVIPTAFETKYLEKIEPFYASALKNCIEKKILIPKDGVIFFKHELYRRTIESSLSPFVRAELNKRVLDLLRESFEENHEIERIIHHAKNANEYDLVVHYSPLAARQAASLGAHIEASRLYLTAIEYYQGNDKNVLIQFYEAYAYECYLVNRIKEAIIYVGKALTIWKEKNDIEKIGSCMRFLSRLWWIDGNRKQAELYGNQAIEVLKDQAASKAKAMAFSNMSQLKMLSNQPEECIHWGEKAIAMAKELNDEEILSHALNNVGTVQSDTQADRKKGFALLNQSLELALRNSFHEHAARAYINIASNVVKFRDYEQGRRVLDEGIQYCEERDLDWWIAYMLTWKARLNLETGQWDEANRIADGLIKNDNHPAIVKVGAYIVIATIKARRGDTDVRNILLRAKSLAMESMELQRIVPALSVALEYEWITGDSVVDDAELSSVIAMIEERKASHEVSQFGFWLCKARKQTISGEKKEGEEPEYWEKLGCPYEQALALFEGNEEEKKKAINIIHQLGAEAVYEKMKLEMRTSGIKNIPRGIRKSTQSNPAFLTQRELDVLQLLKEGMQNKEIAARLYISAKTVDHHISSILFKLDVNSRVKAVQEADQMGILK